MQGADSRPNLARRSRLRARLLDAATVGVLLITAGLLAYRYLLPGLDESSRTTRSELQAAVIGRVQQRVVVLNPATGRADTAHFRSSRRQLVLLFRHDCSACEAVRPLWEWLAADLRDPKSVTTAVGPRASSGHGSYFDRRIVTERYLLEGSIKQAFGMPLVPTTLVLSPTGIVEFARIGVLRQADLDSLRAFLRS